jgi:tetratricopeptide (TPR) repeat protein
MRLSYKRGGYRAFYLELEDFPSEKRWLLAANPPRWASATDVHVLIEKSFALRYSDIRGMSEYAQLACVLAGAIRWKDADHQDARGEAWIQQSSVLRMRGNFPSSRQAITRAKEEFSRGSLRPDLQARLWEYGGTLCRDWRKFRLAEQSLATAFEWHARAGDLADSHRCLVSQAICAGYGGEPKRAVRLAERATNGIDSSLRPDLAISAVIALCWFLVDVGDTASALACYIEGEPLFSLRSDPLVQAHLSWLRGHIEDALGLHQPAEILYQRAAHEFAQQGLTLDRALVLLDLCGPLAAQRKRKEVAALAAEILPEFLRVGLRREAAASRHWLSEASS